MDSRARSLLPHAGAFDTNEPAGSRFVWPHKSRNFEDDPDLLYRYDDTVVEIRHRSLSENDVVAQLFSSELSEILDETVTIWSVASCTHQQSPILAIVACTEKHEYHVCWYNVLGKRMSFVHFDTPIQGPFSRMAMSRLPFTVVDESLDEIEQENNLRHLLVFGSDSGSILVSLLEVDKVRETVKAQTTTEGLANNLAGAITAIDILTQDRHERRLGYIDPRIALGSSEGHVQLLRLRARLSKDIDIIPAQDLNHYVQYPGIPITYLSCTRIQEQRTILLALGQNSRSKEAGRFDSYINVIELYGNWKRKWIGPLTSSLPDTYPSRLLTARVTPCRYQPEVAQPGEKHQAGAKYQVVAVFQPCNQSHTVELAAWSIYPHQSERTDALTLSKDNLKEVIQDIWPLRDAMGYLLLYPQKLLELTVSGSKLAEKREINNAVLASRDTPPHTPNASMGSNKTMSKFASDDAVLFENAQERIKRKFDTTMDHAEQSIEQPTELPTKKPTDQPTEQTTEQPAEQPTEQSTEQPTEQLTEQPTEQLSEQTNDVFDISPPSSPYMPEISEATASPIHDQTGSVDNRDQETDDRPFSVVPEHSAPIPDSKLVTEIASNKEGTQLESPEDSFKSWVRTDIRRAFNHQRQASEESLLSQDECLTILLDAHLTENARIEDLDILTALPYNEYEYLFLARYCWQCPRPVAKLFMMHCSIHRGKLAEAILLNTMIQSSAELPSDLKAMCGTLASLASDTIRPVLNYLPLDIFSQPQGRPSNPFIKQTAPSENFFRQHGLDAGATLLSDILHAQSKNKT